MNYQMSKEAYPFTYIVTTGTIAANATGAATLLFMADSYFEVQYFMASSDVAAERTDNNPNYFAASITDQGTGVTLSSSRVPQRLLGSNMFYSTPEIVPVRFYPNSSLLFDVLNLTAGNIVVTFALKGMKVRIA